MPRNRIYRVLIILLVASTSRAGWNTNIWNLANEYANDPWKPAITNSANITNGTPLAVNIIETNLYAICVTDVITRISTTNYIPAITRITATIPFLSSAGALEFNSHATNIYCWTNTYYTNVSYGGTSVMGVAGSTNYSYSTNFVYNGETNFTTTTVSRVNVGGVYSFRLDADDQRTYEIFAAINEREAAIRGTNASFLAGRMFGDRYMANMWDGGTYYGGTFDNLSQAKQWIFNNVTNFANITNAQSTANSNYDFLPYLSGTNVTYTFYYGSLNHSNGWDTNYTTRTSIPSWTAKELLKHVGAPLNWFGSLSVSVTTNERSQSATFEEMVLVVSNHPIYNIFYTVQTNITPSYAANSYKQYGRDLTGIGFPFSYAVTSAITVIRYPDSKWIIPTGYVTYVTNGITNRWVGYVTNFAYTYNPNEIITNVMHLWDGTVTNVTGTNGQRVTWTNYPASQPYIGYPDSVVSMAGLESVSVTNIDAYGLKYITNILSQLVVLHGGAAWDTNGVHEYCDFDDRGGNTANGIGSSFEDQIIFYGSTIQSHNIFSEEITNDAVHYITNYISGTMKPGIYKYGTIDDYPYGNTFLCDYAYADDYYATNIITFASTRNVYGELIEHSVETYTYVVSDAIGGKPSYVQNYSYGATHARLTENVEVYPYFSLKDYLLDHIPYEITTSEYSVVMNDPNLGFKKYSYETNSIREAFTMDHDWSISGQSGSWLIWIDCRYDSRTYSLTSTNIMMSYSTGPGLTTISSGSAINRTTCSCEEPDDHPCCDYGTTCTDTNGCLVIASGSYGVEGAGLGEGSYEMSSATYWDQIPVRNYAVPNGFKYY